MIEKLIKGGGKEKVETGTASTPISDLAPLSLDNHPLVRLSLVKTP